MQYAELLKQLTVNCKDDGNRFVNRERLSVIKSLLQNSGYILLKEGNLSLLYGKPAETMETYRILISSHIDCMYTDCFVKEESADCWRGTFDNSATNAAVIELMLQGKLDHSVLIAFTGDEEKNSAGAIEVKKTLQQMHCEMERVFVLDVTNEGWDEGVFFSIENDRGFDILTGFQLISLIQESDYPCVLAHEAEPDETWEYGKKSDADSFGIPCLSFCLPVCGDLHSDAGILLRKAAIQPYEDILSCLANAPF